MEGTTLEVLTRQECYRLLHESAGEIGRVAMTFGALPAILPVNYAMLDDTIVFRTGQGTKLHAAIRNAVVAFEVDASDASSGWSVLIVGHAAEVTEPPEVASALAVIPDGWVPGEHEHVVRITFSRVSGRRIQRHA